MDQIEIITRAIILDKGKILLCQKKGASYYFLPGGHVEFGEKAEPALIRELKEELDIAPSLLNYLGLIENVYIDKEDKSHHHEMNLIFNVVANKTTAKTPEDHLEFFWKEIKNLKKEYIEPVALKEALIKWLKDKKLFWGSEKK